MTVRVAIRSNCHKYMRAFYFAFYTEEKQDKSNFIYGREPLDFDHEKRDTLVSTKKLFRKNKTSVLSIKIK